MKITLSVIKADIGSIGGHVAPSRRLQESVRSQIAERGRELIVDHYVSHTGDDIAIRSATWSSRYGRAQPATRPARGNEDAAIRHHVTAAPLDSLGWPAKLR